jgi:hypothetical protein
LRVQDRSGERQGRERGLRRLVHFQAVRLTPRWSGRVKGKVPSSDCGARAARLNPWAWFMRNAFAAVTALLVGCAAGTAATLPSSSAHGGTLSLVRTERTRQTLTLSNSGSSPLAYLHWFSLGPEPVAYCRGLDGHVRVCSLRVMLADDDQPYTHESYLPPGGSVEFQASPSGDEQVGVVIWVEGREEALWLDGRTPDKSLERTRER